MKQALQSLIRSAHLARERRSLPERLAIYFHALDTSDAQAFADAMSSFIEAGYQPVDPAGFVAQDGPARRLYVSFDDNFKSWYSALDAFAGIGLTATFFVNTQPFRDVATRAEIARYFDWICHRGERVSLSRAELVEIGAAGHTIGCHTHTHPVLSRLAPADWPGEIAHSKAILEDLLGVEVADFSYPFGMRRYFSPALRSYCAKVGFRTISTGIAGFQHEKTVDPLAIHRTPWRLDQDYRHNVENLIVDGRLFTTLTGRSAIG